MEVLYEDNHIIAINKKCSDIVQGDKTGDKPLSEKVKEYLKKKYNKQGNVFLGVTHRLDRPVSGVVLFAKTSKALSRLNEMFRTQQLDKTYWAIVQKEPKKPADRLIHYLKKNEKQNKSYASSTEKPNTKKAILNYKLLKKSDNYSLLQVKLETGRHHQIRCQLSAVGSVIKGDLKYGANRSNRNAGISLHARSIEFIHPVSKKEIKITAPTPKDDNLWTFFEKQMSNI